MAAKDNYNTPNLRFVVYTSFTCGCKKLDSFVKHDMIVNSFLEPDEAKKFMANLSKPDERKKLCSCNNLCNCPNKCNYLFSFFEPKWK